MNLPIYWCYVFYLLEVTHVLGAMAFELRINMDWPVDLLNEHNIKNPEIHGKK